MSQSDADFSGVQAGSEALASSADDVVRLLNGGGLYVRTALLLLPGSWLGREGDLAVKLGVTHVNYQRWKAQRIPPEQSFLLYSAERLVEELDALCREAHARSTLLVSVLDLPLSALPLTERRKFWHFIHAAFSKRARGLLLALPEVAVVVPDEIDLESWRESGRLARWIA